MAHTATVHIQAFECKRNWLKAQTGTRHQVGKVACIMQASEAEFFYDLGM